MYSFERLKSHTQQSLSNWLDLIFNQACALCDRPTQNTFCLDCQRQLQGTFDTSLSKLQRADDTLPVHALAPYAGTLKQALAALKYNHRPRIGTALGIAAGQRWKTIAAHPVAHASRDAAPYVIPIPLHLNRQVQRGYNQAEVIARAFCQTSGLSLMADGLSRVQDTLPQHQLGKQSRQDNLKGAFAISKRLLKKQASARKPISVLLIDDIYTTGTTIGCAVQTLAKAKITTTGVVTIARAVWND
ncbi:MAG: ComF family protein [Cyanobacteria bacterium J06573_11]